MRAYKNFNVAGITYYEALFVINQIKVGDKVELRPGGWDIFDVFIQRVDRDELEIDIAVFVRER